MTIKFSITFIFVCVWWWRRTHTCQGMLVDSKVKLGELVLSFYYMDPGDWTHDVRLGGKCFYPLVPWLLLNYLFSKTLSPELLFVSWPKASHPRPLWVLGLQCSFHKVVSTTFLPKSGEQCQCLASLTGLCLTVRTYTHSSLSVNKIVPALSESSEDIYIQQFANKIAPHLSEGPVLVWVHSHHFTIKVTIDNGGHKREQSAISFGSISRGAVSPCLPLRVLTKWIMLAVVCLFCLCLSVWKQELGAPSPSSLSTLSWFSPA